MAKKKENRGGRRKGAGRKPSLVKKKKITVSVPEKHAKQIKAETVKLAKEYEAICLRNKR